MSAAADLPSPPRQVVAGLLTVAAAVITLPDLVGLDRYSPFAQLVAFRPWLLLGAAAALAIAMWFRRMRLFGVGMLAVLLVGGGLVLPRALAGPLPTGGKPLMVLAFNALDGHADAAVLAELIRTERPDIVALVEAGERFRARLAPLVEPLGYRITVADHGDGEVAGAIVLAAGRLGDVRTRTGTETTLPHIEVTGGELGELRFVAFHSMAPVPRSVPVWRSELAQLQRWCSGPTPAVVAGDLNATLDHSALREGMAGCSDAAEQRGAGLIPTWALGDRSRAFGPQIDHVIATGAITAETFDVRDIPGSDHRAVLTRLRVPT